MNGDSLVTLINTLGEETTKIFKAIISNIGAILFLIGILALLVMLLYGLWEVKRNKSTVGDVLSDHGSKIIVIVLIVIAGGIIQTMKPTTPTPTALTSQPYKTSSPGTSFIVVINHL